MEIEPHVKRFFEIRLNFTKFFTDYLLETDEVLREKFYEELRKELGESYETKGEAEHNRVAEMFISQYKFADGSTIVNKFIDYYSKDLTDEEKKIVLEWEDPVTGFLEIKKISQNKCYALNLINEVEYVIRSTRRGGRFSEHFKVGSYVFTSLLPISNNEHFFSAVQMAMPEVAKEFVFKAVLESHWRFPHSSYRDNEERKQKGFEFQRFERQRFIECFGTDEIITEGKHLPELWKKFTEYRSKTILNPHADEFKFLIREFTDDHMSSDDVGLIFDESDGLSLRFDYGTILDTVTNFDDDKVQATAEIVMDYLEDADISPSLIKRIFFRNPQNGEAVLRKVLNRPEFSLESDIDALMDEFKPVYQRGILPRLAPISKKLLTIYPPEEREKTKGIREFKRYGRKIGRNEPCPCKSGKKFKKCCGKE